MSALNPNHKVTRSLEEQWHKLLAIVMHKHQDVLPTDVVITAADLEAFAKAGRAAIVAHDRADGLHLRLVSEAEGARLARTEGGLPS